MNRKSLPAIAARESPPRRRTGTYVPISTVGSEIVRAFVPAPLPPAPPLRTASFQSLLERANQAVGELKGIGSILADPDLFLYMYIRKEAVLSSQIEGTQSSLSDLLLFERREAPGAPADEDVVEVSNHVRATNHGLSRLRGGFPISNRLIREIHEILLSSGRGSTKRPGRFRRSQNWIGGTRPGNARFVPPPPSQVLDLMSDLERFIHEERPTESLLVRAGLIHVQFETIHPFLDGNGRVGRLLIPLLLCHWQVLERPLLCPSLFFKSHRAEYYDRLSAVRLHGDWEGWTHFFLEGISATSVQAVSTARELLELFRRDQERLSQLGRAAPTALRVHGLLGHRPIVSIPQIARELRIAPPTARRAVRQLERLGLISEVSGRRWRQLFAYDAYLRILNAGTEPLS